MIETKRAVNMYRVIVVLLLLSTNVAIAQDQNESVMKPDKAVQEKYKDVFNPEKKEGSTLGDKCIEMEKKIESLKGKPQRRYSVIQLYKQECKDREY